MSRLGDIRAKIVRYFFLKKEVEHLKIKLEKMKQSIIKGMKKLNLKKIEPFPGFDYYALLYQRTVFLTDEKVRKIKEIIPDSKIIKTVSMYILDKKVLEEMVKSKKITPEQAEKVKKIAQNDMLKVERKGKNKKRKSNKNKGA
ncbi:hypothetical protein J7K86_00080 [bacterium]|nr:hypothetical protein [bacterium]